MCRAIAIRGQCPRSAERGVSKQNTEAVSFKAQGPKLDRQAKFKKTNTAAQCMSMHTSTNSFYPSTSRLSGLGRRWLPSPLEAACCAASRSWLEDCGLDGKRCTSDKDSLSRDAPSEAFPPAVLIVPPLGQPSTGQSSAITSSVLTGAWLKEMPGKGKTPCTGWRCRRLRLAARAGGLGGGC